MDPQDVSEDELLVALKFCNKHLEGAWRNASSSEIKVSRVRFVSILNS